MLFDSFLDNNGNYSNHTKSALATTHARVHKAGYVYVLIIHSHDETSYNNEVEGFDWSLNGDQTTASKIM